MVPHTTAPSKARVSGINTWLAIALHAVLQELSRDPLVWLWSC